MKTLKMIAVMLLVGFIAASCEGPEGPKGTNGTNGIDGVDGVDGNANVRIFDFAGDTLTSTLNYTYRYIQDTTFSLDSCMILPYYLNFYWYQLGQMGPGGSYQTRYWYMDYSNEIEVGMRVHNVDGSAYSGSDVIWDSIRIFVIPINTFHMAEKANLDFSNYNEVNGYFSTK